MKQGIARFLVIASAALSGTELHALSLDPTFGTGGRVVLENNGHSAQASKAILQSDGRIVVVGTSPTALSGSQVLVTRLNADGTLDASFGQNGTVSLNWGDSSRGAAVAQQADGKLIVAGAILQTPATYPDWDFLVARLNSDGSLDSTFAGTGYVTIDFWMSGLYIPGEEPSSDRATSVAVQSDGRIVVGGGGSGFITDISVAARLLSDGQLDVSYGTQGHTARLLAGHGTVGSAVAFALTSDDRLATLAVRTAATPSFSLNPYVELFTDTGSLDSSFSGGFYTGADSMSYLPNALLLQSDDKVVVGGQLGSNDGFVARINTDGAPDSTFGTAGFATLQHGTLASYITAVAAEPSGKLLVTGPLTRDGTTVMDGFVSRFRADGTVDAQFDTTVVNPNDTGTSYDFLPASILRSADGRIIVAGTRGNYDAAFDNTSPRIVLVRLLSSPEFRFQATETAASANSTVNVGVRRVGDTSEPVSIDYATENGTAVAGVDFTGTSGTLTWAPGDAETKQIAIAINNNTNTQAGRQFTVKLSDASEGYISGNSMTVTIQPPAAPSNNGGGSGGGGAFDWLSLIALGAAVAKRVRSRRLTN